HPVLSTAEGTPSAPLSSVVRAEQFDGRQRVIIENASPEVEAGAFPAKRVIGDRVDVEADIFADGHDLIAAVVHHRHDGDDEWAEVRMRPLANDRWTAEIVVERIGFHRVRIEAWIDHFLTWH